MQRDFGGLDGLIIGYALDVSEYSFLQCSGAYLPGDDQGLLVVVEGLDSVAIRIYKYRFGLGRYYPKMCTVDLRDALRPWASVTHPLMVENQLKEKPWHKAARRHCASTRRI